MKVFNIRRVFSYNFWKMLDIVKDYELIDNKYSFEYKGYQYEYVEGNFCIFIIYIQTKKILK